MGLIKILLLYAFSLVVFLIIDLVWLGIISKNFYRTQLGQLMSPKVNWLAAIIFYMLFIVGILVFAVLPGIEAGSLARTALLAALFGLVCYATYDLSNLATLKNWPLAVTVVDLLWGTSVSTMVGIIAYAFGQAII